MANARGPAPTGIGTWLAPTRYLAFLAVFVAAAGIAARWLTAGQAVMAGFDAAAVVFLASLWPLLGDEADAMRARAQRTDANRVLLLVITGAVTAAILVAVAAELAGRPDPLAIALVVATLLLAWLFSNTVYALHYAHLFYRDDRPGAGDDGGLDFPGTKEPDYWDFLYFAWTLGMTFQTSDVSIGDGGMRRVALFHCLAAFVFNLGILAFTINVLGG